MKFPNLPVLMNTTTSEQKNIIEENSASLAVISCPGSGKTYTAALRMAYRLTNWKSRSSGIALLSHTNAAIKSFEEQFWNIGKSQPPQLPHFVGTLDSFIMRFLISNYGHMVMKAKCYPTLVHGTEKAFYNSKFNVQFLNKKKRKYPICISELQIGIKNKLPYVYYLKNNEILPENPEQAMKIFYSFAEAGFYTHDHARYWGREILMHVPRLRRILAQRFPEIIIDEAQDSNSWQQLILCALEEAGSKLMLIGDPEQSIFEFSLGNSNHLLEHSKRADVVKKILSKNLRSNEKIVSTLNLLSRTSISPDRECSEEWHGLYFMEYDANLVSLITFFQQKILNCGLSIEASVVISRSRELVNELSGIPNYNNIITHRFAQASLERDRNKNPREAYKICKIIILTMSNDVTMWSEINKDPDRYEYKLALRKILWQFVRDPITGLPDSSLQPDEWYAKLKTSLERLYEKLKLLPCLQRPKNLWKKVPARELNDIPLGKAAESSANTELRIDTVHGVKGETFDAALYVVKKIHLRPLLNRFRQESNVNDELVKIGYVAMSRPRHLFCLAIPAQTPERDKVILSRVGFLPIKP